MLLRNLSNNFRRLTKVVDMISRWLTRCGFVHASNFIVFIATKISFIIHKVSNNNITMTRLSPLLFVFFTTIDERLHWNAHQYSSGFFFVHKTKLNNWYVIYYVCDMDKITTSFKKKCSVFYLSEYWVCVCVCAWMKQWDPKRVFHFLVNGEKTSIYKSHAHQCEWMHGLYYDAKNL